MIVLKMGVLNTWSTILSIHLLVALGGGLGYQYL